MNYLGLDIGGTRTKFCVIDNDNNILIKNSFDYDVVGDLNLDTYSILLKNKILAIINEYKIISIGIAFPGVVNKLNIVKSSPNMSFFEEINILEFISENLNYTHSLIKIDNDANIAAICERYFIEQELNSIIDNNLIHINNKSIDVRDLDNFLYVTLGTGIGGAIFINGKIYRGANGGAGEIGHTFLSLKECIDLNNINNDIFFNDLIDLFENKQQNHFLINQLNSNKIFNYHECTIESFIGSKNFIKIVNELKLQINSLANSVNFKLYDDFSDLINSANILLDNTTTESNLEISINKYFLNLYGFLLGISMASAMNLMDLNHLVLGGGCSNGYNHFEKILNITLERRLLPHLKDGFKVTLSKFGNLSGSYGAAILAKN